MATFVKPEAIPWGERITVSTHEAVPFYKAPGWNALADGQKWVKEGTPGEGRHLATLPNVLEDMIQADSAVPQFWITANSEEIFGLDTEGRIGKKGEPVMLTIHGGGIILESPESLQAAYTSKTPKGESSVQQAKITAALAGMLPNRQQIKVYTLDDLIKEDPAKLPQAYAIAMPLKDVKGTQSVEIKDLTKNKIYVARAGHQKTANKHTKILTRGSVTRYGNHHSLAIADPENYPSGRVLHVGNFLDAYYVLLSSARFVGVSRLKGAEGAAQQNGLEETVKLLGDLVAPALVPQLRQRLIRAGYR